MTLEILPQPLSICQLSGADGLPLDAEPCFFARTDEELSLVCPTDRVPACATQRSDGWRGFRVQGVLDFSLTGILSKLSGVLADAGVGIFAISTWNTDYILIKEPDLDRATYFLARAGYEIAD